MHPAPQKLVLWAICFLVANPSHAFADDDYIEPALDAREQEAVYKVLEAINSDIDWTEMFPDNLCTGGPHGVKCEPDEQDGSWHIVELNLGWVSDFGNNPPCGGNASFSPWMASIPRLRKIFFYRCFMREAVSIPSYIWSLGDGLEELIFEDNPALEGRLSPELGKLRGLRRFILAGTSVRGIIPAEIGALTGLRQLVLSGNGFSGRIPSSIEGLKELIILDVSRNQLQGSIPPEFGGLVQMAKIDVSFNSLDGPFPDSLVHLHAVELMDMSYNCFSGGIPLFLGKLSGLRDLHLSGNPLGGSIPDFWDKIGQLATLGLSNAGLVGKIPPSIGTLKNLNYLALDNNRLMGTIPSQFGDLPQIYQMNLSANELTGLVPFSATFMERMGRKLRLVGNFGLCYDPQLVGHAAARINHLESCSDLSLPESVMLNNNLTLIDSGSIGGTQVSRKLKLFLLIFYAALIRSTLV